ncbi:preprotein translocase subunit SecE [bacterium]|nr:preprotein translocase subunit SecE [bacterium]
MKITNIFSKIVSFLKEVYLEIKKVNWPTRKETLKYTMMVIGISAAVAAFLGGLDFIFSRFLNIFILR